MATHNTFWSVNSFLIQGTSSCFPVITSYTCVTNPKTYAMPLPQLLQTTQPITFHWYCSTYVKVHKGSLRQWDPHPSILLVLGLFTGSKPAPHVSFIFCLHLLPWVYSCLSQISSWRSLLCIQTNWSVLHINSVWYHLLNTVEEIFFTFYEYLKCVYISNVHAYNCHNSMQWILLNNLLNKVHTGILGNGSLSVLCIIHLLSVDDRWR
jgi:hypothetical protein